MNSLVQEVDADSEWLRRDVMVQVDGCKLTQPWEISRLGGTTQGGMGITGLPGEAEAPTDFLLSQILHAANIDPLLIPVEVQSTKQGLVIHFARIDKRGLDLLCYHGTRRSIEVISLCSFTWMRNKYTEKLWLEQLSRLVLDCWA